MISTFEADVAFFALSGGAWLTMAIFATDIVEKKIAANIEEVASKGRTIGKRRFKVLNWPKDALRHGTRLWGFATLLFGLEIAVEVAGPYIGFPNTYGIFFWIGMLPCAIAGFQTYRIFEFVMNPKYQPRIGVYPVLLLVCMCAVDVCSALFFIVLYPIFNILSLDRKLFTLLLIPSVIFSFLLWWAIFEGKRDISMRLVGFAAPYVVLGLIIAFALLGIYLP